MIVDLSHKIIPYSKLQNLNQYLINKSASFLILSQVEPVFTLGLRSLEKDHLINADIPLIKTNRGGQITFHGPGQLMIYPIINLREKKIKVQDYISLLEDIIIDSCEQVKVKAIKTCDTGVWVTMDRKIASIGIHVSRGMTSHGIALNCNVDLKYFNQIVPCGLSKDKQITNLSIEANRLITPMEMSPLVIDSCKRVFHDDFLNSNSSNDLERNKCFNLVIILGLITSQDQKDKIKSLRQSFRKMSHKLCMIPGPVEFDPLVLSAMSAEATSHVDPAFIQTFGESLELMRTVFLAPSAQPFVVSGSGTLTWDMTAANLVEPGESVLVVTTGVFGDWFAECFKVYGAKVSQVISDFGDVPDLHAIEKALKAEKFKLVSLTHVDTSTGVLIDIKSVCELIKKISPETLIAVDGVCSVGGETIKQDEWGIDVVMTASQKAIGVPPGLALMMVSQRALNIYEIRVANPSTYFGSFGKWLKIMRKYEAREPSYFATPPVQLIMALNVSLKQLAQQGMMERFAKHAQVSNMVKDKLERWGLKLVPKTRNIAANTLSAVYYPEGIVPGDFLKAVSARGVMIGNLRFIYRIAGGLHPQYNTKYFRVGHMHRSTMNSEENHIQKTMDAIKDALVEVGYNIPN